MVEVVVLEFLEVRGAEFRTNLQAVVRERIDDKLVLFVDKTGHHSKTCRPTGRIQQTLPRLKNACEPTSQGFCQAIAS